jgi:hypothetical protein
MTETEGSDLILAPDNEDYGIFRKIPYRLHLAFVVCDPAVSFQILQREACLNSCVKQTEITRRKRQPYPSTTEINGIPITYKSKMLHPQ